MQMRAQSALANARGVLKKARVQLAQVSTSQRLHWLYQNVPSSHTQAMKSMLDLSLADLLDMTCTIPI